MLSGRARELQRSHAHAHFMHRTARTSTHAHTHAPTRQRTNAPTHARTHHRTHARTQARTNTRTHEHKHTHTHTHALLPPSRAPPLPRAPCRRRRRRRRSAMRSVAPRGSSSSIGRRCGRFWRERAAGFGGKGMPRLAGRDRRFWREGAAGFGGKGLPVWREGAAGCRAQAPVFCRFLGSRKLELYRAQVRPVAIPLSSSSV
eukprot:6211991-Pleurochrysis_carterae.AAC.1